MKVKIDSYEVEVKAKRWDSTCFNKQDTLGFLCHLCVELIHARDQYEAENLNGSRNAAQKDIESIRAILKENNYIATK